MQAALRAALEGLQMSGGVELNVPSGRMATPLMRHQRLALAWMLQRERLAANPRGGILADDQGLGKTVSTIALIVTNQPGDDVAEDAFATLDAKSKQTAAANSSRHETDAAREHTTSGQQSHPGQCALSQSESAAIAKSSAGVAESRQSEQCNELVNADTNPLAHGAQQATCTRDAHNGHSKHAYGNAHSHETASTHTSVQRPAQQDSDTSAANGHAHIDSVDWDTKPEQAHDVGNAADLPEGGTLIVSPTAVLNQWARELEAKVAKGAGVTLWCLWPDYSILHSITI